MSHKKNVQAGEEMQDIEKGKKTVATADGKKPEARFELVQIHVVHVFFYNMSRYYKPVVLSSLKSI